VLVNDFNFNSPPINYFYESKSEVRLEKHLIGGDNALNSKRSLKII